jgi:hypothetical protein
MRVSLLLEVSVLGGGHSNLYPQITQITQILFG